jgi:hypothetical protein
MADPFAPPPSFEEAFPAYRGSDGVRGG